MFFTEPNAVRERWNLPQCALSPGFAFPHLRKLLGRHGSLECGVCRALCTRGGERGRPRPVGCILCCIVTTIPLLAHNRIFLCLINRRKKQSKTERKTKRRESKKAGRWKRGRQPAPIARIQDTLHRPCFPLQRARTRAAALQPCFRRRCAGILSQCPLRAEAAKGMNSNSSRGEAETVSAIGSRNCTQTNNRKRAGICWEQRLPKL